jgi:hypothetical protein
LFLGKNTSADLTNVDFIGNDCAGHGGAIWNWGSLTYDGGVIDLNTASYFGGGIYNKDQTFTPSSAIINNVEITRNTSDSGGGIMNDNSNIVINNSLIYYNAATQSEGASGGGIFSTGTGTVTLENDTITNNRANAGGGGIFHSQNALDLNNVTITENFADYDSNSGAYHVAGGILTIDGVMNVNNTIIAANTIGFIPGGDLSDCYNDGSAIGNKDYNIQGVKSSGANACDLNGPHSIQGSVGTPVDPRLGPLQNNGGLTQTHALLGSSPAIDAGNPGDCPAADQRGVARPVDGDLDSVAACDIGAFEFEPYELFLPLIQR